MQFGLTIFPTDYAIDVVTLGKAAEEAGFESLFLPEHTHIPTSRRSPWPGGAELPQEYAHTLDPFVALAAVAGATTTLKLGTGICLVIEHDPIVLAKVVASLDHVSNGRVLFGIGGGWNLEEMEDHGTDPAQRWKVLRERILAMKEIWTKDEAEYHGKFVNFDPLWSWPKPVQQPHPPIMIGGNGPHTFRRVIEYGDEWIPIGGRIGGVLTEQIAELQQMAKDAGRAPIPITMFGIRPQEHTIARFQEMGISRCLFMLPPSGADEILPLVKQYAQVAKSFASAGVA